MWPEVSTVARKRIVPKAVTSLFCLRSCYYRCWQWKGQALWLLAPKLLLHNQVYWRLLMFLCVFVASSVCAFPVLSNHSLLELSQRTVCSLLLKWHWKYLGFTNPCFCSLHPEGSQHVTDAASRENSRPLPWMQGNVWGAGDTPESPTGSNQGWDFIWNHALGCLFPCHISCFSCALFNFLSINR